MSKGMAVESMDDWQVEQDLRAICRAQAVEKDPERMAKVKALAKKRLDENKINLAEQQKMVDLGEGKDI